MKQSRRTYDSPATQAQRDYIMRLLEERVVPEKLQHEIARAMPLLTDGNCREFIPKLEWLAGKGKMVFNASAIVSGANLVFGAGGFVGGASAHGVAPQVIQGQRLAINRIRWGAA